MFSKVLSSLLSLFALLISCVPAAAVPGPIIDLTRLANASEIIAVGQVLSVRDRGAESFPYAGRIVTGRRMEATLRAYRLVKGTISSRNLHFYFVSTTDFIGYSAIFAGQLGMFFFKASQAGVYSPASAYYPFILAEASPPSRKPADVLDRIAEEIMHFHAASTTSLDQQRMAVFWLGTVQTALATGYLRQLASGGDADSRVEALSALMKRGDLNSLPAAVDLLIDPPALSNETLLRGLDEALRDGIKDPRAIPDLVRLLSAKDAGARWAGAGALRDTYSRDAIAPLSTALYDSDRRVRYEAVIGLAEITGQDEWGPSIDLFNKDEARFLTHWRDWAKNR